MKKIRFFKIFFSISVIFIVAKVYQHNKVIKLNYEKQLLEQRKKKLIKKKNELMVLLAHLQDYQEIKKWAQQEYGMNMTELSHCITLTFAAQHDFFVTGTLKWGVE